MDHFNRNGFHADPGDLIPSSDRAAGRSDPSDPGAAALAEYLLCAVAVLGPARTLDVIVQVAGPRELLMALARRADDHGCGRAANFVRYGASLITEEG